MVIGGSSEGGSGDGGCNYNDGGGSNGKGGDTG